jgi:hypothetical protein
MALLDSRDRLVRPLGVLEGRIPSGHADRQGALPLAEYHSAADHPEVVNAHEFARAAHGIIETVRRLVAAP